MIERCTPEEDVAFAEISAWLKRMGYRMRTTMDGRTVVWMKATGKRVYIP